MTTHILSHYCFKCEEGNDLEQPIKVGRRWVHPSCLAPDNTAGYERDDAGKYAYACGYQD